MRPKPDAQKTRRQAAEARGQKSEWLAAWLLRLKGYRILARRFRCPAGEIDLIAQRGHIIAFVEVKARADMTASLAALTPKQRQRIARAAALFLSRMPEGGNSLTSRFDLIALAPGRLPRHLADAWRLGVSS